MAAPMPVSRRSPLLPPPRPADPIVIRVENGDDIAATSMLTCTAGGLEAVRHVGSATLGRFVAGHLPANSDTVFVAWARQNGRSDQHLHVVVEQSNRPVCGVVAGRAAVADLPTDLTGIDGAYVLWLRVRAGNLSIVVPPRHAIVSLGGIARWVETTAVAYCA
jgi:hypothetical protein